jgi:lipopolysaccharide transport system ATP-binding protein
MTMADGKILAHVTMENMSLRFPLYHAGARSLKKTVLAAATGRLGRDAASRVVVEALREISVSIGSGERIGLIGGNGAGKTSLLRAIAGIYEPAAGTVRTRGSMNVLLDPNLGMNPDLTGRENIFLRGLYHGISGAALRRLEEDVANFSELAEFLDLPLRIYSAGMSVRLGFALATAVQPQILLMDEWFLAGDAAFLQKAHARLEDLVRGVEILVLATHQVQVVRDWCTRVILLDQGRVRADGPPGAVLDEYFSRVR